MHIWNQNPKVISKGVLELSNKVSSLSFSDPDHETRWLAETNYPVWYLAGYQIAPQ